MSLALIYTTLPRVGAGYVGYFVSLNSPIICGENMKAIIEANELIKEFSFQVKTGDIARDLFSLKKQHLRAVDNVSLQIIEGERFGLLGPNGAGKTTLIKLLTGLLEPTLGTVLIEEKPIEAEKNKIGLMLGYEMIYNRLSGYDNLAYFAKLYGIENFEERIRELAKFLGLSRFLDSYVETYSLGMKSKLALARALINDPKILFLDEPTLGLDPGMSFAVREKIKNMDKTIFLTTHSTEEAVELCDRIAIMNKGKIVKIGKAKEFKNLTKEFIKLTGESK